MSKHERWLVYPVLAALSFAVFGGHLPFPEAQGDSRRSVSFETVTARAVWIENERGVRMASITPSPWGGSLTLYDGRGKLAAGSLLERELHVFRLQVFENGLPGELQAIAAVSPCFTKRIPNDKQFVG